MYRARRKIGATLTPKDTTIKDIGALHGGKNIRHFDRVWATGECIAPHGATRRNHDVRPIELLEYLRKEAGRGSRGLRDVSELYGRDDSVFRQDHQSLNCIAAVFAQLHLSESMDEFSPLAKAMTQSVYHVGTAAFRGYAAFPVGALLKIRKCLEQIPIFANRWVAEPNPTLCRMASIIAKSIAYGLTTCTNRSYNPENHFVRGGAMAQLPKAYESFKKAYPKVWQAYDRLGAAVHDSGPLEKKNRELLKLAMAIGARLEGAVHSHTRRALEAGATAQEVRHVVLLGVTTLGFPHTVAALTWVEDDLKANKRIGRKADQ